MTVLGHFLVSGYSQRSCTPRAENDKEAGYGKGSSGTQSSSLHEARNRRPQEGPERWRDATAATDTRTVTCPVAGKGGFGGVGATREPGDPASTPLPGACLRGERRGVPKRASDATVLRPGGHYLGPGPPPRTKLLGYIWTEPSSVQRIPRPRPKGGRGAPEQSAGERRRAAAPWRRRRGHRPAGPAPHFFSGPPRLRWEREGAAALRDSRRSASWAPAGGAGDSQGHRISSAPCHQCAFFSCGLFLIHKDPPCRTGATLFTS